MRSFPTNCLCVLTILVASLGYVGWGSQGIAETSLRDKMRISEGRELAQIWCSQCHLTDPEGAGYVQGNVPTFAEIASRTGQTIDKVKLFLVNPHPPMPNLSLSRDEIDNLATYILSLRQENAN